MKLFFARNIGLLGSGPFFWIDTAKVNGMIFFGISNNFTGTKEDYELIAANYNLYQNYPNPFNPSTRISYSISIQSKVSIIVYDVLGKVVTTLANEEKSTGNYSVEFNAAELSSGVYFYQLRANGYTQTRKMVLLR